MIVVKVNGAVAGGADTDFFLSDRPGALTGPFPPYIFELLPDLIEAGSIGLHLYADGQTGGTTSLEIGEMTISNTDGSYDNWISTYGFDGRRVSISLYAPGVGTASPTFIASVFVGTVESVEADFKILTLRMRDRRHVFDVPVLSSVYAGSNVLPAGLEGTPDDIMGTPKPRIYGYVWNVPAICVNTSTLTYQISDEALAAISAVYDAGVPLTFQTDYATSAAMQAAAPPAVGSFYTCIAEGYFRLRSTPAGEVTADANSSVSTAADVVTALATAAAVGPGEQDSGDITAMNAANSSAVGIFINEGSTTFREAMDQILASVGGCAFFDGAGVLRRGILTEPSGTPVLSIKDYDVIGDPERRPARDVSVPAWQVTVEHSKIYTIQTSGLAAGTTDVRRAILAKERRAVVDQDASVKTKHLLATALTVQTLLADPTTASADAATEATRLLNMYKVNRDAFEIPIRIELFSEYALKFLDVVEVVYPRFDMTSGRSFRLIGVRFELAKELAILTLWG